MFPGDIVQIHAPKDDTLFCEEFEEQVPYNGYQQQDEDSATGGQPREEQDNTPQRLSPIRQCIPAGAEGGELAHPLPPVMKRKLQRRGWHDSSITPHIELLTQPSWTQ